MKYVLFEDQVGFLWPVVFPDHISHCDVKVEGHTAVGAGLVTADGDPYGKSDSLKLESHKDDRLWLVAMTQGSAMLYTLNADREAYRK